MQAWRAALRRSGERRLLLVEADSDLSARYALSLCRSADAVRSLWVGRLSEKGGSGLVSVRPTQAHQWLGRELDLVIWDGRSGNPPDDLAALMGTLAAGAVLVWLMPPLAEWADFDDPDYARTGLADAGRHPFLARMATLLDTHPAVVRLHASGEVTGRLDVDGGDDRFQPTDTPDQSAAIDAILRAGAGRRRRPLVIRADRGRGKSTALGRAAAQLLQDKWTRILVTAPRSEAVDTLFAAAEARWPGARRDGQRLQCDGHSLEFVPADVLLRERPDAGVVLVDEAAGLPAPLLADILTGWPRVVFATTVHGYEGTGRGFDVRFRDALDRLTPQWQTQRLSQPIRWRDGDPFEDLVNRLFLLDAESVTGLSSQAAIRIEPWCPAEADSGTLAQAFGLLTDAHYRTTPADLRQWLDDPHARSWLARSDPDNAVVGVLWATAEGGLAPALAEQVMRGERRARGHLLAQSLACHGGLAEAAMARMARVVRIAVVPELRREGIGQRLLAAARNASREAGFDLLGSSFGATAPLLAFWRGAGFYPLRLGLHRSASSGEYTLQMGQALSAGGMDLLLRLQTRFAEHWPLLLGDAFRSLEPDLALSLGRDWVAAAPLTPMDRAELAAFAGGYRLFELSRLPLMRLSLQAGVSERLARDDDAVLWCRAVLQGWPWSDLQSAGLCRGRRDAEQRLRQLAGKLLEPVDIPPH
ncbi:tRNA(Met) cytidine acetyltransferase [Marinobacter halodurans]|uniref:tRNA(Met) cytidine acetyltransferase TmcA n=1 Tax=Marinobacter halodurans TaxID=2528979 RepID=A0ABY1ZMR3_9GAMM|nr:tRNA(Met) cytidine acetyltransferase [Marinobacter halodurans]